MGKAMNDNISSIPLNLSVEQINQILDCLGQQPYRAVYQLIADIRYQCDQELTQSKLQTVKTSKA